MRYAQINGAGICVGVSELGGKVDSPTMIELAPGAAPIGKRWDGAAFVAVAAVPLSDAEAASVELEQIDRDTGMSRTAREVFIAIAKKVGADVAYLEGKETAAKAARVRRGA